MKNQTMTWTSTSLSRLLLILCVCCTTTVANAAADETSLPLRSLLTLSPDKQFTRQSEGDLIQLKNGDWAFVWSRFTDGDRDESSAHLAITRSSDRGATWTSPTVLLPNEGGRNVMSVSLRRSEVTSEVLLFYLRKDTAATSCTMHVRRSSDELATLSDPVRVTLLDGYHVVNNDRIVLTSRGRWIVPAMLHPVIQPPGGGEPRFHASAAPMAYFSDDDGRTWNKDSSPSTPPSDPKLILQENGIVELANGELFMFMRTNQGCQYQSVSKDHGISWTPPGPSPLKSPLSPASIERIPGSGDLLCIWNDHSGDHPFPEKCRTPLCISVSNDNGKTWTPSRVIEGDLNGWYCYTSITWIGDECILSYCAGDKEVGLLNRSRAVSIPRSVISDMTKSNIGANSIP